MSQPATPPLLQENQFLVPPCYFADDMSSPAKRPIFCAGPGIPFNGTNSRVVPPNSPIFHPLEPKRTILTALELKVNSWISAMPMFVATDGELYPDCYTARVSLASSASLSYFSEIDDIVQNQARQVTRASIQEYLNDGEDPMDPEDVALWEDTF